MRDAGGRPLALCHGSISAHWPSVIGSIPSRPRTGGRTKRHHYGVTLSGRQPIMTGPARLFIAAVAIAGTQCAYLTVGYIANLPIATRPPRRDLGELPTQLGQWVAQEGSPPASVDTDDGSDFRCSRIYQNASGDAVSLYVAIWQQFALPIGHPPERCYPAFGYQILERKTVRLNSRNDLNVPVRFFCAERGGDRIGVLFWYQRGEKALVFDYWRRRVARSPKGRGVGPPLVKVMLQTSALDPADAEEQLKSIAAPVYAWTKGL